MTVLSSNCVSFEAKTLQIPRDEYRCNYIRVKVRIHLYTDRSMAIFHGPRKLVDYDAAGNLKAKEKKEAMCRISHKYQKEERDFGLCPPSLSS